MVTYKRASRLLLALIILVDGYVILAPFYPQLLLQIHKVQGQPAKLQRSVHAAANKQAVPKQPNHIVIPAMALNQPVYEGTDTYGELAKGVWRWPGGSTPDKGGNTVMLGHRFTYTNPRGVFYELDKLHANDELSIVWNNRNYIYKVVNTQVVLPSQTSILNPTTQPTLTLYTCTPTWNPTHRLVVTARLEP